MSEPNSRTPEPIASNFGWGTRYNHGNDLSQAINSKLSELTFQEKTPGTAGVNSNTARVNSMHSWS